METVDKVHPWHWAKENLSEPRARAFWKAYREIEQAKFSEEYYEASREENRIRIEYIRAQSELIEAVETKASQEINELENQARELMKRAQQVREAGWNEVSRIQSGVYETEEYKAQRAKVSELWRRDDEKAKPKLEALIEKYRKAQEASK